MGKKVEMGKVALTDGSGKWFKIEACQAKFDESTWFDGNNLISHATGSQWHHEALYYTKSGLWVRNWWSQYQNEPEGWEQIDSEEAAAWLMQNECFDVEGLPAGVKALIQEQIDAAEI